MKHLLQERINKMLMMIYENDVIPLKDIMMKFNISDRTVRNDIKELNEYLSPYGAKIILLRKKGYTIESKQSLDTLYHDISQYEQLNLSIDSLENRVFLVITYLLSKKTYASANELCRVVYVSPSTMTSYLRSIKESIQPFKLKLISKNNAGYKISGSEKNIRRYIIERLINKNDPNYMTTFSAFEVKLLEHVDLEMLYTTSLTFFPPETYPFSDYSRKNFIIQLAIMMNRLIQGHFLSTSPEEKILTNFSNHSLTHFLNELEEQYQITIGKDDRHWLLSKLLPELMTVKDHHSDSTPFSVLVTEFLKTIKKQSQLNFTSDKLLINDLNNHFSRYLPIKSNNLNKPNPLLPFIKKRYAYAYKICTDAVKGLSSFDRFKLNEHDIGYLALHITTALERRRKVSPPKINIIILCSQGFSTSRLIETKIKQYFSDRIEITNTLSYAEFKSRPPDTTDLIVSTVPIKCSNIPVFYFDLLHLNKSLALLEEQLNKQTKQQDVLNHLFHPADFFYVTKYFSKAKSIYYLLENYLSNKSEAKRMAHIMMARENTNPTNISSFLAIPHIMDDTFEKSKILTLITDQPIKWDSQNTVNVVFMMLISNKDSSLIQTFMEWINNLLANHSMQEQLSYCQTFDDFLDVLREHQEKDL
ncbi:BglG family transcription antiterminator [Vagococcus xieshaowenii]|uniref:HTH domain-containing protein n=1 Tax=Vagococcus xieshaowenii TaxID=2562451 RepID=A0AAJ5ED92_9ENTE|nr:PTS sugar transporter subunit IIA [Vagococcus xieshaowenii]QCA29376.1 HTH domain-containing protein [Vagococcus xieshaowenii]TFZ39332.1 HTH domain-containing protein [Vagococcus xieshaowenii]